MSVAVAVPSSGSPLSTLLLRRFSVREYHQMILAGILNEDEPVELLEGWVVIKMPRTPGHDLAVEKADAAIRSHLPTGWRIRVQCAVTTADSEPEPDIALVRGPLPAAATGHPRPDSVGLIVEVAETSLEYDRTEKGRIYARELIPRYWIINVGDRQIEVYTDPTGPAATPAYRAQQVFAATDSVPLVLDGREIGHIAVGDMLP